MHPTAHISLVIILSQNSYPYPAYLRQCNREEVTKNFLCRRQKFVTTGFTTEDKTGNRLETTGFQRISIHLPYRWETAPVTKTVILHKSCGTIAEKFTEMYFTHTKNLHQKSTCSFKNANTFYTVAADTAATLPQLPQDIMYCEPRCNFTTLGPFPCDASQPGTPKPLGHHLGF